MEWGYCITVHKSQGSQYDSVVYYRERMGDHKFQNRLDYTAVTRAIYQVRMFIG